ncbi:MAG: pyridoxal-dependent decarboxylase [Acidimicrobiia bacterium]|jgi:glutamate/tyrosine decarboxylase-like PLP-dependent enzyme
MTQLDRLLALVVDQIVGYRAGLRQGRVTPSATRSQIREVMAGPAPDQGTASTDVIEELIAGAEPGLMGSAGPRYFGFVVGGSLDAALAADLLASGWDQVAFNEATSPAALAFEDVAGAWLKELLRIPSHASVGYVTGAQAANNVGLAAARWKVLRDHGWDVGVEGLFGAPPIRVVVGEERHATIDRSLRLLGIGERAMAIVPAGENGAMDEARLAEVLDAEPGAPTIVVAQAGNVNTGAFDDLEAISSQARRRGAWLHVDGAFGLWAAVSPGLTHLVDGLELADSWCCDGHKWLNVPYDSGYAFCAHPEVHATSMAYTAEYLTGQVVGREFGGGDFVPESSRRARGFATWAAIKSMGRSGLVDLIERCCRLAQRLAEGIGEIPSVRVVNEVVLNQVLIRVGDTSFTDRVEGLIQEDGTVWMGATTWRGERLLRVSISNWATDENDIDVAVASIERAVDRAGE